MNDSNDAGPDDGAGDPLDAADLATEGPAPQRLATGLDRVLAGLGSPAASVLATVVAGWADLVGEEAAAVSQPVSLEHGTLVVAVTQPAWVASMRWMEADVVRRAGRLIGPDVVARLEVRTARR